MNDKERDDLIELIKIAEGMMEINVKGLAERAKRVEYAVKTRAYRATDVLQLNELIGLLWSAFERAEVFYDVERVKAEMKNTTGG